MKVEQISIFLENRPGALEGVTKIISDAGINIRALSLADTSDFGILRLIVNDVENAWKILKQNGYTVKRTDVVAVEVPDRPGGLHSILAVLNKKGINVEYMYAYRGAKRPERHYYLPLRPDRYGNRGPSRERIQSPAGRQGLPDVNKLSGLKKGVANFSAAPFFCSRAPKSYFTPIAPCQAPA